MSVCACCLFCTSCASSPTLLLSKPTSRNLITSLHNCVVLRHPTAHFRPVLSSRLPACLPGRGRREHGGTWGFGSEMMPPDRHCHVPQVREQAVCVAVGAADHQLADKQHSAASDAQAATVDTFKPDYMSTSTTANSITFHTPPAARSQPADKAALYSPGPVAPTTPDHTPALPPCKVNPMRGLHSKRTSQDPGREEEEDVLSSFQQLLGSRDGDQHDRLSKFRQLLASQEVDDDGKPLSGLAGRVRSMASQLNALQKRTQVGRPL